MSSSRSNSESAKNEPLQVGLAATGRSAAWSIDVDHHNSLRGERWFFQIESDSTYLYFEVDHLRVVDQALSLLESRRTPGDALLPSEIDERPNESVLLGRFAESSVTLVGDNEFVDRCFIRVGSNANSSLFLTIAGEDLVHFTAALKQVRDELKADRLLAE